MPANSTQQFIDIAGIKDGVVILKNGSYRMIFEVSAINFSLKSEEEQNSIIFQYQSFLNSLHSPIQVVIRSKKMDLNPYIKKINALKEKQTNELLKIQMDDYTDFIGQLVNVANIMKKNFYVVIPYDPIVIKKPSVFGKIFSKEGQTALKISDQEFKRYKDELVERANTVASGLGGLGMHCVQLNTEQMIELFYQIYNPEIAEMERFSNVEELTSPVIESKPKNSAEAEKKLLADKDEEDVIDNTALVEQQRKIAVQEKEIADAKEAIPATPAAAQAIATPQAQKQTRAAATPAPQPNSVPPQATPTPQSNTPPAPPQQPK